MGSMADQFLKAGLITSEQHQKVQKKDRQQAKTSEGQMLASFKGKTNRPASLARLEDCKSISEFKDTARKLLEEHPEEVSEVIRLAHDLQKNQGTRRLIWLLYQVRDNLPRIQKSDERSQFLRRALRKSGGTIELPQS